MIEMPIHISNISKVILLTAMLTLNPILAKSQELSQSTSNTINTQLLRPTYDSYILGPGDRVNLNIYGLPDYSGEHQILLDGTLNLPLVGAVSIAGMSIEQATSELEDQLSSVIRRPFITIDLLTKRPLNVAVAGEVNRPGSYIMTIGEANNAIVPTVTQAIQLAGGIRQTADIRNIQVRRFSPLNSDKTEVLNLNLWELIQSANLGQDITLRDGDSIFIPKAEQIDPSELTVLASASFSPDTITVNVVGEVNAPGALEVPPSTTLHQAILAAGGFNNAAATDSVELIRLNANGTVTRREISVNFTADANEDSNPALQPNDAVFVRESQRTRISDFAQTFLTPVTGAFSGIFNLLRLFGN